MIQSNRIALLAALIGVAPAVAAPAPAPAVRIDDDRFSKLITLEGPAYGKNNFFGTSRTYRIRSWIDRATKSTAHQLYIDITYVDGQRRYVRAAGDEAQDLALTRIAFIRLTRGCSSQCAYNETVGVDLPQALLEAKAGSGFEIKLYARSGDALILMIPAEEIAIQLKAIADYRAAGN